MNSNFLVTASLCSITKASSFEKLNDIDENSIFEKSNFSLVSFELKVVLSSKVSVFVQFVAEIINSKKKVKFSNVFILNKSLIIIVGYKLNLKNQLLSRCSSL
jgi:hypothetical protein